MSVLTNIPLAILNNIGFTAILFLVYQVVKSIQEKEIISLQAAHLFSLATIFHCMAMVQFLIILFYPSLGLHYININLTIVNKTISPIFSQQPIGWLSLIGWIYCIVLLALIFKTVFQFYQLSDLINKANFSNSSKYTHFLNTLPIQSKGKTIKLGFSSTIESPISFGWLEPIILLPIALVNQLTIKEIESIILHEWAHILRNDYLINIIASLIQVVLFFNPFAYLFNKEISLQREIACDNFVLSASVEKLDYLSAIYKIATGFTEHKPTIQNNWTMGILNMPNELLYRVKSLTKTNRYNFKHSAQTLFATFIISSLFFIPFNFTQTIITQEKWEKKNQPIVSLVSKKFISSPKVKKPISILKHRNQNTTISKHSDIAFSNPLINNSYDELVQKTVEWIKSRESINQFVNYQENNETFDTEIAEKLLMNAILTNYQLKRDILNDLLTKAPDKKEALDYVMNSKEWEQMQKFENWTAEFLKKHPQHFEPTTTIASLNARLIVY